MVFITAAKQATTLKLTAGPKFDYPVIASASLAAGTVISVEITSFVSAFSPTPEFETSKYAAIHREAIACARAPTRDAARSPGVRPSENTIPRRCRIT